MLEEVGVRSIWATDSIPRRLHHGAATTCGDGLLRIVAGLHQVEAIFQLRQLE